MTRSNSLINTVTKSKGREMTTRKHGRRQRISSGNPSRPRITRCSSSSLRLSSSRSRFKPKWYRFSKRVRELTPSMKIIAR